MDRRCQRMPVVMRASPGHPPWLRREGDFFYFLFVFFAGKEIEGQRRRLVARTVPNQARGVQQ